MEVSKNWVLQAHVSLALTNHQRQVANLELAGLMRLESLRLRMDFNVLVLDLELGAVDLNFLVCRVLDDDRVRHTLANRARKLESLNLSVILDGDLESVENVLSRVLGLEGACELVDSCSKSQEIELVVLVALSSYIEGVSTTDEKSWLLITLNLPSC